jgi:hypothetical protein
VCRYENFELFYQINAHECTQLLLKHNLISTLYHSDMFEPSKGQCNGVRLIHCNSKVNKMIHQT